MSKKIVRRELPTDFADCLPELHPVLRRIYVTRGIRSQQELERNVERLQPYASLLGIDQAAKMLAEAISTQQKILIVGDFDADGATSSALAMRALKQFGAQQINFLVPNRFAFGYGLTPELVAVAKQQFDPDVIVTVDNGIANHAGVEKAKAAGMKVIITDHHLAAATLPPADAIVNPNQPGDNFPSKNLAGVGVIFYVLLAVRRQLINQGWFVAQQLPEPNMSQFLDLVALGTVADLVPLDVNNRILVHQGLRRIRAGQCIPGILALLEVAGRDYRKMTATDLGFIVAPRLNAAGRLDDMSLGIACLLSDDVGSARELARQLHHMNEERRGIEKEMHQQALTILEALQPMQVPNGICLYDKDWHQGVIGILASRIKERYHRPVIVFAKGGEHELKGSARSIPGLHIRDVLADIAVQYPGLIQRFGGHAMAAGLTLAAGDFERFAEAFNTVVTQRLHPNDLQQHLLSDGELAVSDLNLTLAETLSAAGPWGQAFPEPLFDDTFKILDQRLVGEKHLKMVLGKDQKHFDAIAFFVDLKQWPNHRCQQVRAAYHLDVNEYRERRQLQLIVQTLEVV